MALFRRIYYSNKLNNNDKSYGNKIINDLNKSSIEDIKNVLIVIQLIKYNDSRDPIFLNNIYKINKHFNNPNNQK